MKRKSLLWNILISSVAILAAALIIVCAVFSINVSNQYTRSIKSDLYHTVATESAKMDAWFTKHTAIADGLAKAAVERDLHDDELQSYIANVSMACSDSIMNGYLAWDADKVGMVCGAIPVADDYVAQERGWYQEAKATGGTIITAPYIDVITGAIVITVASPLYSGSTFMGVCGLDIEVTELVTLAQELKADQNGYAVLVDNEDNIVVHSKNDEYSHKLVGKEEKVTKLVDVAPIYKDVLGAAGSTNVVSGKGYDGTRRYFPVVPIGETDWKVLYAADYGETMAPLNGIIILAVIVSVAAIAAGTLFFYFKLTKRLKPLSDIAGIVTDMSNGVLEHNYPKAANDEIGMICDDLRMTNDSLKSYVDEIGRIIANMANGNFTYDSRVQFAGEFAAVGESLKSISTALQTTFGQFRSVSEQISGGSKSVSEGAARLADAVREETRLIGDVHDNLEDISHRVSVSTENAEDVKQRISNTAGKLGASNDKMSELTEIMESISRSATEIVKINSTIESIAFQTNILALNASIEAARAGAAGKGFAVVAEEVRNLATKSAEASGSTTKIIGQTVESIESGAAAANTAAEMLGEVVAETNSISDSVAQIAKVSEEQKAMISQVVDKLGEVSAVIRTNEANAQTAADSGRTLDDQVSLLNSSLEHYR